MVLKIQSLRTTFRSDQTEQSLEAGAFVELVIQLVCDYENSENFVD